jgi:hypothetical protein
MPSLAEMAVEVLTTADGRTKTALGREHARAWFAARAANAPVAVGHATPPLRLHKQNFEYFSFCLQPENLKLLSYQHQLIGEKLYLSSYY